MVDWHHVFEIRDGQITKKKKQKITKISLIRNKYRNSMNDENVERRKDDPTIITTTEEKNLWTKKTKTKTNHNHSRIRSRFHKIYYSYERGDLSASSSAFIINPFIFFHFSVLFNTKLYLRAFIVSKKKKNWIESASEPIYCCSFCIVSISVLLNPLDFRGLS